MSVYSLLTSALTSHRIRLALPFRWIYDCCTYSYHKELLDHTLADVLLTQTYEHSSDGKLCT